MNIQAMMKQAQKLQKEMMTAKETIDNKEYFYKSANVEVTAMGTKQIKNIKLNFDEISQDDIETVEDMLVVAINNVIKQIDEDTEATLGKYTQGMPGLF